MLWTSDTKQSLNLPYHGKQFSKSFQTLEAEATRHYANYF